MGAFRNDVSQVGGGVQARYNLRDVIMNGLGNFKTDTFCSAVVD